MKLIILCALKTEFNLKLSPYSIFYTGVGKINSAICTTNIIHNHKPDLIINYGTCGNLNKNLSELVEVDIVLQWDINTHPIAKQSITPFCERPNTLNSKNFTNIKKNIKCASGDTYLIEKNNWLIENKVDIIDMELFGIAASCYDFKIPWLSFKYISDSCDKNSYSDWKNNYLKGENLFLKKLEEKNF